MARNGLDMLGGVLLQAETGGGQLPGGKMIVLE